jgi:hypothetical protein
MDESKMELKRRYPKDFVFQDALQNANFLWLKACPKT